MHNESSDSSRFGVLLEICLRIMVCVRIRVAACGGFRFQDLVDSSRLFVCNGGRVVHINISFFGFLLHNCALFDF